MTNSPFFSSIDYNEISTLILFNVLNQRNTIKDIVLFCYVIMSCMLYESNSFDEQIFYVHQLGHFNYRDIVHFFLWTFLMIMRYKKENEIQSEIKFCNEMISYIKLNKTSLKSLYKQFLRNSLWLISIRQTNKIYSMCLWDYRTFCIYLYAQPFLGCWRYLFLENAQLCTKLG